MKRRILLTFVLLSAFYGVAGAGSLEGKRLIKNARADWRARTGETMDEVINKVRKVAHFIPARWDSSIKQKERYVYLFWKKIVSNSADEELSVNFEEDASGKFIVEGSYSEFDLGSSAFAIGLMQQDLNDEVPGTDTSFNFTNKNYDFLHMPHGTLAQALDTSHCHLKSPAYVYYISNAVNDPTKDMFYVSLTADCAVPGDTLFTHDGYLQFRSRKNSSEWEPVSYLAKRFWQGRALTDAPNGEE